MIYLVILGVYNLCEIGCCQTLVIRLLCKPVIIKVIIGNLGVILLVLLAVLAVLEGECP